MDDTVRWQVRREYRHMMEPPQRDAPGWPDRGPNLCGVVGGIAVLFARSVDCPNCRARMIEERCKALVEHWDGEVGAHEDAPAVAVRAVEACMEDLQRALRLEAQPWTT